MQELHIAIQQNDDNTYLTTFLDAPPSNQHPADIYEMFGYRVGVYPTAGLSMAKVRLVVEDVVRRLAADDRS